MNKKKERKEQNPLVDINGWQLWQNDGTGHTSLTKPWVLFHPIYDGFYFWEFDTEAEARAFATIENFVKWEQNLL